MKLLPLVVLAESSRLHRVPLFRHNLTTEGVRRRDRRITRRALQHPSSSAFETLFASGCDQSLINFCGFDHAAFRHLLTSFERHFSSYSPYSSDGFIRRLPVRRKRRGRPRSVTATSCLALPLAWYRSRGSCAALCMLFGITGTVASNVLRFGRRLLLKTLTRDHAARIIMPNDDEVEQFKAAFKSQYSLLGDVFAVADGLKLYLQQSSNGIIQNMFYNGWQHDHFVSNVFVFSPDGVIIACSINAPGSMHDSTIAEWGSIYKKLEEVYENSGETCVVDSAFSRGNYPFLLKSAQDVPDSSDICVIQRARQATFARQSSEWGMRALKGAFPRLHDRLPYEERGERRVILNLGVRLFNIRTRLVGLNQILNFYMPHLSREANMFLK